LRCHWSNGCRGSSHDCGRGLLHDARRWDRVGGWCGRGWRRVDPSDKGNGRIVRRGRDIGDGGGVRNLGRRGNGRLARWRRLALGRSRTLLLLAGAADGSGDLGGICRREARSARELRRVTYGAGRSLLRQVQGSFGRFLPFQRILQLRQRSVTLLAQPVAGGLVLLLRQRCRLGTCIAGQVVFLNGFGQGVLH